MQDTDIMRNALCIIEKMLDEHDNLTNSLQVAKTEVKVAQRQAEDLKNSKSQNQLLVNATGEVAQLKREIKRLDAMSGQFFDLKHHLETATAVIAHGKKFSDEQVEELKTERKMRADAEHAYKETEALREDLGKRLQRIREYASRELSPLHQQAISTIALERTS